MELTDVVVVAAKRSPMGLFGGSMKDLSVLDIGSQVIKKTLESIDLDPKEVDMTVFGNCRQAGNGTNPARIAAELAGIPIDRFAQTVNCACPTGIKATIIASQDIRCGDGEIIVAGGMESMSTIPHLITGHRWEGFRLGDVKIMDGWNDTIDKIAKIGMGLTAENVAETLLRDDPQGNQGKRKYPWPVDILLYPANVAGLINLLIFWLLPIGVSFICRFIFIPCLGFILSLVVPAYMIYYFADCIRDSAKGNTRAPENTGDVPGVRDAFAQLMCVIATIVMAFLPAGITFACCRQVNGLVWVFFGLGVFMLPIALLATIMQDTGVGLNPLVWIMAVLRTLIPYLGLAGVFLAMNVGVVFYMRVTDDYLLRHVLVTGPFIYAAMILMHLFGRFYYRYEKRLNW